MKILTILLLGVFWTLPAFAGDIIGNGGGVWSCGSNIETSKEIFLVDFYEAETEWQWSLKKFSQTTYEEILQVISQDIEREFPSYSRDWVLRINRILGKSNFVEADLEIVDDALYRSRPKNNLCLGDEWKYLQFANYTHLDTILIQKDIWNSPLVEPEEKAGLIVHEAIYEWFRDQYKDGNSTRARYTVGLIFANLDKDTKNTKLRKLIGASEPPPAPENGWICAYNNMMSLKFYLGFAKSENLSMTLAEKNCYDQDEHPEHCLRTPFPCEQTNSSENKWVCTQKNAVSDQVFIQQGRTRLEALVHTQNACVDDNPSLGIHCEEPRCERN